MSEQPSAGPSRGLFAAASPPPPVAAWLARHELSLVVALTALAVAVRFARWQVTAVMFNDGPTFLALAEEFSRLDLESALSHPFHPLYPALVALAELVVGRMETAAVAVSALAGAAAVPVLHGMVRSGLSPAHGVVAAGVLALHPTAIEFTGDVQSEGLYLLLFLATAAMGLSALRHPGLGRPLAAGMLGGAAYLTRPEGLGLVVVIAGVAGLEALRGRRRWLETAGFGLALAAGVVLVASPYLVWLRADQGAWTVTQKKTVSELVGLDEFSLEPLLEAVTPESAPTPSGSEAGSASPEAAPGSRGSEGAVSSSEVSELGESLHDLFQTHVRAVHYGILTLLTLALLFGTAGRGTRPYGLFVGLGVGFHLFLLVGLSLGVGYVSSRHALPPMVLLFGYAAGALLATADVVHRRWPRLPATGVATALALALALAGLGKALRPDRVEDLAERRAAEWLRAQSVAVQAVGARRQRVAWYAGAPFVELSRSAHPEGLRELGVSHVILADDDRDHYPRLDETLRPPRVELLHRVEAGGESAAIYVLGPSG